MNTRAMIQKKIEQPSDRGNRYANNATTVKKPNVRTTDLQKIRQIFLTDPDSVTHEEFMMFQSVVGYKQATKLMEEGKRRKRQGKESNTGLPDNLKTGVENLSGISMNNVKVHYNSNKPGQIGALAYTQGTDIHLASGQDKHLPHETWHVVQQAQGRVKPTIQRKSITVNDNASLEKEADIMGAKSQSQSMNSMIEQNLPHPVNGFNHTGGKLPIIQCKVGLEFQTSAYLWTYEGEENSKKKLFYGDKVFKLPGKFHVESDDGQIEFVTEPFDENEAGLIGLVKAVTDAVKLADLIAKKAYGSDCGAALNEVIGEYGKGQYNKAREIYSGNHDDPSDYPDMSASPQATVGIRLDKIIQLMEVISRDDDVGLILGGFGIPESKKAQGHGQQVMKNTLNVISGKKKIPEKTKNFLALIANYLYGAEQYAEELEKIDNYPKIAHPIMARNNFRTIFNMLPNKEKRRLKKVDISKLLNYLHVSFKPDEQIYKKGYRDENDELRNDSPTVREWIDSIMSDYIVKEGKVVKKDEASDKLSRLPGMMKGRGLGALKQKDVVAKGTEGHMEGIAAPVFELRRMMRRIPTEKWVDLAILVHKIVNTINKAKNVNLPEMNAEGEEAVLLESEVDLNQNAEFERYPEYEKLEEKAIEVNKGGNVFQT